MKDTGDAVAYAPPLPDDRLATLVRGARATILPVVADAVGLAAVESIAAGVPVLASAVGALPELVGPAGVLVPPGDPDRLAVALRTLWTDDALHTTIRDATLERAAATRRTWDDVARETRVVYATVGIRGSG